MEIDCAECGYIQARIEGSRCEALLDSGAEINVMPLSMAKMMGINYRSDHASPITGVGGLRVKTRGKATSVVVEVGGIRASMIFHVMEGASEIIFGKPFNLTFQAKYFVDDQGIYQGSIRQGATEARLMIRKGKDTYKLNTIDTAL